LFADVVEESAALQEIKQVAITAASKDTLNSKRISSPIY
jgi:hypothetical protein